MKSFLLHETIRASEPCWFVPQCYAQSSQHAWHGGGNQSSLVERGKREREGEKGREGGR